MNKIFNNPDDLMERIKPISNKINNFAINLSPSRKGLVNTLTFLAICLEEHQTNSKKPQPQNSSETKLSPEIQSTPKTLEKFLFEVEELVDAYQEISKLLEHNYLQVNLPICNYFFVLFKSLCQIWNCLFFYVAVIFSEDKLLLESF